MASIRSIVGATLTCGVIVASFAAALFASPASAVNECERPGFAASFDRRFTGCEEVTRIPIHWRGHSAEVVVLKTEGLVLDARSNAVVSLLRRTVDRVAAGLNEMGSDFDLDTVYVMLTDDRSASNEAEAYANPLSARFPDQCHVAVFVGTTGAEAGYVTFVMAHELFHCVQMSTWEAGLRIRDNSWWVEGSAEYFANLAFPGTDYSSQYVTGFHEASADTPLTDMSYENAVFFSWIDQRLGAPRVRAFMHNVSNADGGEQARAAAAAALDADQWLNFAKDYVAGEVQLPGGVAVGPPTDMPTQSADTPLTLIGSPLVIARATLTYEAGRYENRIEREGGPESARHGGAWATLPSTLNIACEQDKEYIFAAMSAAAAGVETVITPTRTEERTCVPCGDTTTRRPRNSCLIGTWHFPGHQDFCSNFSARLGATGARVVECNPGTGEVTFAADGTATSSETGQHIVVNMSPGLTMQIDQQMQSSGRWSTNGAELQLCDATSTLSGVQIISGGGQTRSNPVNQTAPTSAAGATFACTPTTLTITSREAPGAFLGIGPEMVLQRRR